MGWGITRGSRGHLGALALLVGTALSWPEGAALAQPATAEQAITFTIPAQPLRDALIQFSQQSGVETVFDGAMTQGRSSSAVSGALRPSEALGRLLAGSGLAWRFTRANTVTLIPAPVTAPGDSSVQLPEMNVQAGLQRGWSPVRGYVAEVSTAGTKTDASIIETPQSLSVVTRDQMDAQRVQTIRDALLYTPGILPGQGFSRSDETLTIRGFQGTAQNNAIYRDGLRWGANNYGLGLIEPYGLERIEVLRGPASVLYGSAEPGGIVNLVSKRPLLTPLREIELSGGSYNNRQLGLDFGGPIDAAGVWSYRLTGLLRESDTMVDHIPDNRRYIAPAITWRPSPNTTVTVLASYYNGESRYNYGYPFIGTVLPNRNGQIPTNRFVGEPGYDRYLTENLAIGYLVEHRLDETWTLRQNARYLWSESQIRDLQVLSANTAAGLSADQRTVSRSAENRRTSSTQFMIDNQAQARFRTGPAEHTVLLGLDAVNTRMVDIRGVLRPNPLSLDLFAPRYGTVIPVPRLGSTLNSLTSVSQIGLYAQDQIRIANRLVVLVGGRQDWVNSQVTNRLNRSVVGPDDGAFTGRVGLVYLTDIGLAPYASYAESFQPSTSATLFGGGALRPTTGQQYEIGIRYQPPGMRSLVSLAAYQLTKQNVVGVDAAHPGFAVQIGEQRSRGIELEGRAQLTDGLAAIASYAYTDAEITKSATPAEVGRAPAAVPMHQASLWADYTFREGPLRGLGIGGGVRYMSSTRDTANSVRVPDFTLVDAMARYDLSERWRISLNATNLFDKQYVAACTYACFYGERLTVTAALRHRF